MPSEHLGHWLRTKREARGLTQNQLAQRMGLGMSTTVSRWERGANDPSLEQFAQLCRSLEASADEALGLDVAPCECGRGRKPPKSTAAGSAG